MLGYELGNHLANSSSLSLAGTGLCHSIRKVTVLIEGKTLPLSQSRVDFQRAFDKGSDWGNTLPTVLSNYRTQFWSAKLKR